jgi:imidazolonepropionase
MSAGALAAPRLATATTAPPLRGAALTLDVIEDAAVAWNNEGLLTYVGPADGLPGAVPEPEVMPDALLVPGFVDCHTHLPFFGWRADEYAARLAGASYAGVQGEGGGIPRSARLLAGATDEEVLDFSERLALEMLAHGTTTLELKTGYGGSVAGELRQARLARALAARVPQTCSVTLLPCHAVPEGWAREDWVRAATDEVIPQAAAEGLADQVDIYVEDIAFAIEDLEAVAAAAAAHGLPLRVHADQLGDTGAAAAAARLGAVAADHLNHANPEGIAALGGGGGAPVAVLLPASTFCLGAPPPPVHELLDAGAAVAIATDCNPGTSPVASMPETIVFACRIYGLSPEQALAAATANPANVLGLGSTHGRLAPGMRADLAVVEGTGVERLAYRPGHDPALRTYVAGELVSTT